MKVKTMIKGISLVLLTFFMSMLTTVSYSQTCTIPANGVLVTIQNVQAGQDSITFEIWVKNTTAGQVNLAAFAPCINLTPTSEFTSTAASGSYTILEQPSTLGWTGFNPATAAYYVTATPRRHLRITHTVALGVNRNLPTNVDLKFIKVRYRQAGINFTQNAAATMTFSTQAAAGNIGNTIMSTNCGTAGSATSTTGLQLQTANITLNPSTGFTATMSGGGTVCAGTASNISVAMSGGTSPYTLVYGDGTNSYTVNSYVSGSAISVTPSASSTYTITSVSDATPTAAGTLAGSATVTVNQPSPSLVTGSVMNTQNQLDGTTMTYQSDCDLIGKITDAAGGNALGATTMTSALAASNFVGGLYGFTYCKRTFVATPTSNGAGVVTLYMTPSDFTDFNANKPSWMSALPITPADPNLANLRVTRESGGVYTNVFLAASSFTWNALGYWELQVNVPSVGGNYLVTSTPDCINQEVTGLTATTMSGTTVLVSWAPISGYGWFQIQRRTTSPQGAWIPSGSTQVGATSALIGALAYGTSYDFRVVRVCSPTSLGNWTTPVSATTNTLPCSFAPNNLTVPTVGITNATATWNAVSGYGWYGVRYRAYTAGNTNPWINITSASTSAAMIALTGNTTYEVQVKTFCTNANAGVSSDWSASTQFTTMPAPPTPCTLAPTGLAMSAITATTATATWNAVAGAGWYGFQYRAQNLTTPNPWISSTTGATTKNLTGLVSGTTYEVSVKVFCNNNNPGLSSAWSDTTFNFTAGGQAKLSASVASNEVSVYPNPTSDELNIDVVMDNESMTTVKVMDMSGRVVKQIQASTVIGQNNIKISLAELTAGLYTIQVINNDKLMNVTRVSKN